MKMKKYVFLVLVLIVTLNLSPQNTIVLPDVEKPHQIAVDGNDVYIFDEADYSLHIFTLSPFALKLKIGKKGDGPHDFKYLPYVYIQTESLAFTDFTKTLWFSKDGKFLRGKEYTEFEDFDLNSEMLLIPIRENYLRITADHGLEERHVYLLDSEFKTIKKIYLGPFIWNIPGGYRTDTICYNDKIIISDTQKGFFITMFDSGGNHLLTIDKNPEVEKVSDQPRLHQYCVSDEKIYATTYKKEDGKTEMVILDLKGQIIKRLYLPLLSIQPKRGVLRYDLYIVNQDKLYELVKNSETGNWELFITDLE